eukprot:479305_1
MALLVFSNMHRAEYVNVIIKPSQINIFDQQHNNYLSKHTNFLYPINYKSNINIGNEYEIQVFTITIPSSIKDFWDSKAYELAIVIAVASLIWPYIKLIILLIIWLIRLPQNIRTRMILFIDQAGKWSYMDLYASVVMTVCFYVHTSFEFKNYNIDIRIVCEPDIGIITFVIANLLSMAYSHIFIFLDQQYGYKHHVQIWTQSQYNINVEPQYNIQNKQLEIAVPIYKVSGVYDSFYKSDIDSWRKNKNYKIFAMLYRPQSICGIFSFSIYLLCLWSVLWLIIEIIFSVPARFDIEGIVGIVIGSPSNIRQYNPIQTANELISSTDKYNTAMFLSICYWITICIFPILTQIVLILIWFSPIKHKYFVFLFKSLWFIQAWNAIDVFFIGTISGAIEMNTVSKWIIDSTYSDLCGDNGILTNVIGMDCFNVMGHITKGCWMAGIAAIIQWYQIWFSLSTAKDIGVHGLEY